MTRRSADLLCATRLAVGEAPLWDPNQGCFVLVDITGSSVLLMSDSGQLLRTFTTASHVGAALPRRGGGWLLAMRDGFATMTTSGGVEPLLTVHPAGSRLRFNDAKGDPRGRALAGTMHYAEEPGQGSLYRLDPGPKAQPLITGATISNGLGWSPDGGTFTSSTAPCAFSSWNWTG